MCKHEELIIEERGTWQTTHTRIKTGEWFHDNEPGEYSLMLRVYCEACNKKWKYYRRNAPKWLRKYLDEEDLYPEKSSRQIKA